MKSKQQVWSITYDLEEQKSLEIRFRALHKGHAKSQFANLMIGCGYAITAIDAMTMIRKCVIFKKELQVNKVCR